MKVGIIGSGNVGRVLATGFLNEGHEVMLGTRNTSKEDVVKWKKENTNGLLGSFQETAQFGELIVLAVSGLVVEDAINLAGKGHLSHKIIIDATNPIAQYHRKMVIVILQHWKNHYGKIKKIARCKSGESI